MIYDFLSGDRIDRLGIPSRSRLLLVAPTIALVLALLIPPLPLSLRLDRS
jgi:hypothetical protein